MATDVNIGFVTIPGWMYRLPGLSLPQLIAYATIYGFSQDGTSLCHTGRDGMAARLLGDVRTADRAVQALIARGLVAEGPRCLRQGRLLASYKAVLDHPEVQAAQATWAERNRRYAVDASGMEVAEKVKAAMSKAGKAAKPKADKPAAGKASKPKAENATSFISAVMALGVTEQTAKDWAATRKKANASFTATTNKLVTRALQACIDAGVSAEDAAIVALENSWRGFKAEWVLKRLGQEAQAPKPCQATVKTAAAVSGDEFLASIK